MKTLLLIIAIALSSCSTTELTEAQSIVNAANAAINSYKEKPTK